MLQSLPAVESITAAAMIQDMMESMHFTSEAIVMSLMKRNITEKEAVQAVVF